MLKVKGIFYLGGDFQVTELYFSVIRNLQINISRELNVRTSNTTPHQRITVYLIHKSVPVMH